MSRRISQAACHAVFWTQTYVDGPWMAVSSRHPGPDEIWLVKSQVSPASQRFAITLHKQTEPKQCQRLACICSARWVEMGKEEIKTNKVSSSENERKLKVNCFCTFKIKMITDLQLQTHWSDVIFPLSVFIILNVLAFSPPGIQFTLLFRAKAFKFGQLPVYSWYLCWGLNRQIMKFHYTTHWNPIF